MAEKFRSFIKVLNNEINKHQLFNATTRISSVTGRAQEKLNNIQSAVAAKYDVLAKQISNDLTIIQNVNGPQLAPSPLPKKVVKWWQWYQQITGLDKVEIAKQQVIFAQDKLFKCQDERRQLNREAMLINDKLKEVYSELIQIKRDDPKYVQLTIVENKNLQDQTKIMTELNLLEKEEKEHFTLLATAIKEYHDSQTMNAQKHKYLSIVASALLAIISLVASIIYNNIRVANIQNILSEAQEKNENVLRNSFLSLENSLNTIRKTIEKNSEPKVVTVNEELDNSNITELQRACVVFGACIVGIYILRSVIG
ncbi:mitochondrial potassium channel-like [Bombus impatiens]|uniref:mitochondrial potassium channel-like n=1 Tax=Bombus impatiens TaxID=132113 RepID=A0A6P3V3R8_BOMIM|nr:mitochondrial potassium channel-like [Bombus impatiens]XP_012247451.1 mitochondrial potassium channel-like [Bombus impatiens]